MTKSFHLWGTAPGAHWGLRHDTDYRLGLRVHHGLLPPSKSWIHRWTVWMKHGKIWTSRL